MVFSIESKSNQHLLTDTGKDIVKKECILDSGYIVTRYSETNSQQEPKNTQEGTKCFLMLDVVNVRIKKGAT